MNDNEFYLCQPAPARHAKPSCAACCGMYNWAGCTREMVREILERQTDLKLEWDGTDEGIEQIKNNLARTRPAKKFEMIYNCEFLGFIDEQRTRVGCLMHPTLNQGRNLRDHCKYSVEICGQARCTGYTYLDDDEARAVAEAAPDWYLYGLCLTDIDLVKEFFDLMDFALHHEIPRSIVHREPTLTSIFHDYLALKETWPFARDPRRFGKYYFPSATEYRIAEIDYDKLGVKKSSFDTVLVSLASIFESKVELFKAEDSIQEIIDRFVIAYTKLND